MKRLSGVRLRVADMGPLIAFYTDVMGMTATADTQGWRLGYPGADADLIFLPGGSSYSHSQDQRYWKIGVTLPNLAMAHAQLRAAGVQVSQPRQFLDIGYMAHLSDPAGFVIELLQWDFDGNRPPDAGNASLPLGGQARIGQITLRTGDMAAERDAYSDMQVLSVQNVADHGFDLHFLAYAHETPPVPDVTAVANREWLWKRPYTLLEFQHVAGVNFTPTSAFEGLEIAG
ncbi:VOC family protein [Aliisedimentitalea scapharcae]|uniref:VOC family protein n=1 Tax=Aliisedimentitalea scapharcae TaxID=1524259 RepID=A0ABZ2XVK1_9RHOB